MMRIIVVGAGGRMGRNLVRAIAGEGLELAGATERPGSDLLGRDAGELAGIGSLDVPIIDELQQCPQADVLIDFTLPESSLAHARFAAGSGMRMVVGTTGFTAPQLHDFKSILSENAVVMAANFSIGVNLTLGLIRRAAEVLDESYDAEIIEAHHKAKVDAPSGTALAMGRAVAEGRAVDFNEQAVYTRHGHTGQRENGSIGFSVIRAGDIVGEHTTMFAAAGERVEIRHVATDRMTFANGAVRAAKWLQHQSSGFYDMCHVLDMQ
ncbi:MAG: 4-hydroxy-tetrahydrodipicolinate reductase [Mariprofundaceae bacterium]